ncbi:hypothetical protein T4B_10413 [Trichinella pseudospiralis]|uniref:Uncharacterized protein n=1 Tax=Trichinella pseudospiralis TaxID=6337 RepID=A0A0V1GR32_TRIPS|nr:hypothetical protein T4A_1073 [Trichinella pseudospiralis]KRZ00763.1 hypothetical protein T4B_11890 [Trichinella pseudospiralis]KRZ00774.1 hypothetical protein T4B_15365 [Trichinella pseudospiralis]KRZ04789.1 hypothetical protein T4B_10413 [Trichinella pseudospiralis]KRZ25771.1 hypothetical protein T4C_7131 [Trichinella pseudospiralis]
MADVCELRLVPTHSNNMSFDIHWETEKNIALAPKYALNVQCVLCYLEFYVSDHAKSHIESCLLEEYVAYIMKNKAILIKRSVDKAEPILAIYDEEASATSTVPLHLAIFRFSNG